MTGLQCKPKEEAAWSFICPAQSGVFVGGIAPDADAVGEASEGNGRLGQKHHQHHGAAHGGKGTDLQSPQRTGKDFYPNVNRDAAVMRETQSFLNRIYRGSVGLVMSAMTQQQMLSQEEIEALRLILQEAGEGRV